MNQCMANDVVTFSKPMKVALFAMATIFFVASVGLIVRSFSHAHTAVQSSPEAGVITNTK